MSIPRSLEQWEAELPTIRWREPLLVNGEFLACRVCLANRGLRGCDAPKLPTDPADFAEHMRAAHGVTA